RVFEEHFVDFLWSDFLSTAIDDFIATAHEKQVAVVIKKTQVPRLEPITREGARARHGIAVVARRHTRPADDDLPRLTSGQECLRLIHDRDLQTHWHADRTRFALARRQRIAGYRSGSGLRHAVSLDRSGLESLLQ